MLVGISYLEAKEITTVGGCTPPMCLCFVFEAAAILLAVRL